MDPTTTAAQQAAAWMAEHTDKAIKQALDGFLGAGSWTVQDALQHCRFLDGPLNFGGTQDRVLFWDEIPVARITTETDRQYLLDEGRDTIAFRVVVRPIAGSPR